ncbi:hypothetical protein [Leptospira yasudae]|uniref:hypothetical protein n=1 Tax=Leptospira yasudae TaxID=2202201 RepID=UPI0010910D0B|nr:hypothetical protein [Leptospira yasudae]MBW0434911.1 hypothetical protein [Leptospira yasudae]TGM99931.1 hypothetical protein EHR10_08715 [Leptospira yasudae]
MNEMFTQTYLHSVDLDNSILVNNLLVDGRLRTPNFLYEYEPLFKNNKTRIEDQSIENLKYLTEAVPPTFTPRAYIYVLAGAAFRTGGNANFGHMLKEEDVEVLTKEQIIRMADIELAFEQKRREIDLNLVSRLSCIWLAEDNDSGRKLLSEMLGEKRRLLVRVKPLFDPVISNLSKVDVSWYNKYYQIKEEDYIKKYWTGFASQTPQWEVLYDGIVELVDKSDWDIILKNGKSFSQLDYGNLVKSNRPDWFEE